MKKLLFAVVILFVLASCSKDEDTYYVTEIIRLEQKVNEVEYERDVYKEKLKGYEVANYLMVQDTSINLSLKSIKTYARFYPN